ncbi:hypothetical protein [Mesonia sp.]|uniref:hypothetical protein n=1 Tax=Mesonia sp. TaxID=1960830 RepID=UPI003F99C8E4
MQKDKPHISYIPSRITSAVEGYELLLRLHNDLSSVQNKEIHISFKYVIWLEANLCAILGAIIEALEARSNVVRLIDYEKFHQKSDILSRNGFFNQHDVKIPPTRSHKTPISYKKFKEKEAIPYNQYIQSELIKNPEFPNHSEKLGKKIKENIFELFENARTHGKCNYIHTCGQFYPNKKKLHITIVDTGETITNNVQRFLKNKLSPCDCIQWAMKKGNTTKKGNIPGGLGLGLIFEFINLNKGENTNHFI